MNPEMKITNFLHEMLQWEKKRYSIMRSPDYRSNKDGTRDIENNRSREELTNIFSKYLSPKAVKTVGGAKISTMGVGNPPIYDQSIDSVEDSGKKIKIICISNNGALLDQKIKYTLIQDGDHWVIDEVHSSEDEITWKKKNSI